jgi:CheY-like chemotaxis protein
LIVFDHQGSRSEETIKLLGENVNIIPTIFLDWNRPMDFQQDDHWFLHKSIQTKPLIETLFKVFKLEISTTQNDSKSITLNQCYLKILIVDDDIINRKILQRALQGAGCSPTLIYTASNGQECIESLKQQSVDIIMMDLEMPIMGGLETTQEIRKFWPQQKSQPYIIGISATATKQCENECIQVGMNGFLGKPFRFKELIDTIRRVILEKEKKSE